MTYRITTMLLSILTGTVFLLSIAQAASPEGSHERGETLYREYSCYACHGYTGETGTGTRLNPPRFNLEGFMAYVRKPSGRKVRGGAGGWMPPYVTVPDQDLIDIYAYLQSLPSSSPPLEEIPLLKKK